MKLYTMSAIGIIQCSPKSVKYVPVIEDAISIIEKNLTLKEISIPSKWVCLKLIDGNEKILSSIEKNVSIEIKSKKIKKFVNKALALLERNSINHDNFKDYIVSNIMFYVENVCKKVITYSDEKHSKIDMKIDKILTSKLYGIPIMLVFLGTIFWITIVAANIPSKLLANFFAFFENKIIYVLEWLNSPKWLVSVLISGIYKTVTWIISVMLPPMAIFFPLFTLFEDLGVLPRIAFNLDNLFKKACTNR